jgi:hypothetical protein
VEEQRISKNQRTSSIPSMGKQENPGGHGRSAIKINGPPRENNIFAGNDYNNWYSLADLGRTTRRTTSGRSAHLTGRHLSRWSTSTPRMCRGPQSKSATTLGGSRPLQLADFFILIPHSFLFRNPILVGILWGSQRHHLHIQIALNHTHKTQQIQWKMDDLRVGSWRLWLLMFGFQSLLLIFGYR